jgi:hypothetical protein
MCLQINKYEPDDVFETLSHLIADMIEESIFYYFNSLGIDWDWKMTNLRLLTPFVN